MLTPAEEPNSTVPPTCSDAAFPSTPLREVEQRQSLGTPLPHEGERGKGRGRVPDPRLRRGLSYVAPSELSYAANFGYRTTSLRSSAESSALAWPEAD